MSGNSNNGVFQNAKGQWGYRFSLLIGGKRITRRKFTDENGIKLTSKRAAEKAREAAINLAHTEMKRTEKVVRRTMADVFKEYSENGRFGKAYQTIRKQDSLWENHICPRFGKRFVDDISVAEICDFLSELYYIDGYSFQYTESFLKMFYLIFGQAYSRNYLDVDTYNKMCVNKNTKIKMPKIKSEDDTEIVAFSRQELSALDDYFKGTNAETAYLLGRYCGLRINHCTITLKDGKQTPIVIENLPIHYEDKLWGGKSQSEIDACVKYVQQSNNMLYGQYMGKDGTNLLNRLMGGSTAAEDKINVADDTRENLSKAVKDFNNTNFYEFDGTRVELKDTKAAGEWWLHFTCVSPDGYFVWGGSHGTYRALELFTNDPNGDCETASAGIACILNVMGYTTRYITNSGKDQWIVMDNGVLCSGEPSTFGTRVTKGHTINFVNKGFNSYWVQDYPELLE